jgi:hypothetical protein
VVIDKGLNSGDVVVTEGQLRLMPGSHVSIRKDVAAENPAEPTGTRE